MAWFALWKWFSTFRVKPYDNMIEMYRKFLYGQWWDGLSHEEQLRVIAEREAEENRRHQSAMRGLRTLMAMTSMLTMKTRECHKLPQTTDDMLTADNLFLRW